MKHLLSQAMLAVTAATLFVSGVPVAQAAGRGSIDVEHFHPQQDGWGLFSAESPAVHDQWGFSLGFFLPYSRNPFIVMDRTQKRTGLVEDRLTGNVVASMSFLSWLQVGASIPVAFWNDQNAELQGGGKGVTGFGSMRLQVKLRLLEERAHGLGLSVMPAVDLPTGNHNAFLGQNFVVFSPMLLLEKHAGPFRFLANFGYTARERTTYKSFVVDDELFWNAGIGLRVHPNVELGGELFGSTPASAPFGSDVYSNPLELSLGARLTFAERWQVYVGGGPGLTRGYGTPTYRLFAGLIFAKFTRDTDGDGVDDDQDACPLVAGPRENKGCPWPDTDGDGLPDNVDKCPQVPGPKENGGCPWPDSDGDGILDKDDKCPNVRGPVENQGCPWPDTDGDGVLDKDDKCPTVPGPKENQGCPLPVVVDTDRDKDGVLDKDDRCPDLPGPKENQGCPWPDRDGDGILDKDDKCPDLPGPKENRGCPWPDTDGDGVLDKDDDCPNEPGPKSNKGCPIKAVVVTKTEIRIMEQVFFKTGSAKILPKSFDILNKVVDALNHHKEITLLEVQGHTDDVGSNKLNTKLSAARAKSVLQYLVKKGIAKGRLESKGYGPSAPLVVLDKKKMSKAEMKEARAKNRRVQFVMLKMVQTPAATP